MFEKELTSLKEEMSTQKIAYEALLSQLSANDESEKEKIAEIEKLK